MNIARFSVSRPVTILMASLAVVVLGLASLSRLKIDLLPDFSIPFLTIVTRYPGAAPEEVEEFVTKPIEEAAELIEGIKKVRSTSREGVSTVIAEFEWGTDMDFAEFDAREKIDPVIEFLPEDAKRPIIAKIDPSTMMPVVQLVVTGTEDLRRLRELADDIIKPELEKIPGVAAASIYGGLEREILVEVDQQRLEAYDISLQQISTVLRAENINFPVGYITEGKREFVVRTVGQFSSPDEILDVVVGIRNSAPIRVRDIARVKDTHKEVRNFARANGNDCVVVAVQKQSVANTTDVSDRVQAHLDAISKKLPSGVELDVGFDEAEFIRKAIANLKHEAVWGSLLALLIILLFIGSLRSTLVTAISIPMSFLVTFVAMYFNNMTLNVITLGGLVLAIGRIVDDSIVVLENISRHAEEGESVYHAAVAGTQEVALAIAAATFTTMCVFFPLMFVGGMVSQIFTPMSLVVIFGLGASLVVALTLIPMLCTRILRRTAEPEEKSAQQQGCARLISMPAEWLLVMFGQLFERVRAWYRRAVTWVLSHRALTTAVATGIFLFSLMLTTLVGMEFFPTTDQSVIQVSLETPIGSSIEYTSNKAKELEKIVQDPQVVPELKTLVTTGGEVSGVVQMAGGQSVQKGSMIVNLVKPKERKRTSQQVQDELRKRFAAVPGIIIRFLSGMGGGMGAPVEIVIRGDDLDTLSQLGQQAKATLKDIPGLYDIDLDWKPGRPEYQITIDRTKAGTFGITAGQVGQVLQTLLRGTQELTKYREKGEEYDITVRAAEADREWIQRLQNATIPTPRGELINLTQIATIRSTTGPTEIGRNNRRRAITVQANTSGRPLSEVIKDCRARLDAFTWPEGYDYTVEGTEKDRQESFAGMWISLIVGILLIYIILASQFESLLHPLTIMLAIPLEVIGVFAALLIFRITLSIMVFLGILMLTGIVVSNSILLVNIINILRDRGMPTREAIIEGGMVRLRPILMTALATFFALVPVAIGLQEGSELWQPLAIAVLGGLTTSTFLTLLVVPVAYSIFDEIGERIGLGRHKIELDESE